MKWSEGKRDETFSLVEEMVYLRGDPSFEV